MKVFVAQPPGKQFPADGGVEPVTLRYNEAYASYHDVCDKNTALMLNGGKPSALAQLEEERAYEQLDVAQHALLTAAALAYPTIH